MADKKEEGWLKWVFGGKTHEQEKPKIKKMKTCVDREGNIIPCPPDDDGM